jgi:sialic acid synthase SpsE
MSTISEIKNALKIINKYHNNVVILHCVSDYPTKIRNSNLEKILYLKKIFSKNEIGLSDHTNGISTSLIASNFGISYIEKHFNLDNLKTTDSSFSINPEQLKELSESFKYMFGKYKEKNSIRKKNFFLRRSIFSSKDIKKNEKITTENINTLRPRIGICASQYFKVLGKKTKKNIKANEPIFANYLL